MTATAAPAAGVAPSPAYFAHFDATLRNGAGEGPAWLAPIRVEALELEARGYDWVLEEAAA